jgi:hypothetical protein
MKRNNDMFIRIMRTLGFHRARLYSLPHKRLNVPVKLTDNTFISSFRGLKYMKYNMFCAELVYKRKNYTWFLSTGSFALVSGDCAGQRVVDSGKFKNIERDIEKALWTRKQ